MKHHHPAIRHQMASPLTMSGLGQVYQHMAQGFFNNGINNTIKKFNVMKAKAVEPFKLTNKEKEIVESMHLASKNLAIAQGKQKAKPLLVAVSKASPAKPSKVGTTASNRAKLLKILQADRPDTSRAAMNKAKLHKAQSK